MKFSEREIALRAMREAAWDAAQRVTKPVTKPQAVTKPAALSQNESAAHAVVAKGKGGRPRDGATP